jgi:Domain of unknown function (DUF4350)
MPAGIAAADRKLLMAGGGLVAVMALTIGLLSPPGDAFDSKIPSTYSVQSSGAAAAYRLLNALHYPVRRWENPPTELNQEAGNTLLILAEPNEPPTAKERQALDDFVKEGGHVLFTGPKIKDYFPEADVSLTYADPKLQIFDSALPSQITREAKQIWMQPHAYWETLTPAQLSLYGASDSAAVVSWQKGDGEILWWAGSTPLSNAGITRKDNLRFFLNSVAKWPVALTYQIYWDEYFHGQRTSLWSYVGKTSLSWIVVQLGILALAVLFTFSRRSGPIYVPAEVSRLSPLEFVDTLGGLYERAGAASLAVSVSYSRLRTLLSRQLSLPSDTGDAQLATAAEQRLGWNDSGLDTLLRRARAATLNEKFSGLEALAIVQELERLAEKLTVRA